jgi:hypothetical protein
MIFVVNMLLDNVQRGRVRCTEVKESVRSLFLRAFKVDFYSRKKWE